MNINRYHLWRTLYILLLTIINIYINIIDNINCYIDLPIPVRLLLPFTPKKIQMPHAPKKPLSQRAASSTTSIWREQDYSQVYLPPGYSVLVASYLQVPVEHVHLVTLPFELQRKPLFVAVSQPAGLYSSGLQH